MKIANWKQRVLVFLIDYSIFSVFVLLLGFLFDLEKLFEPFILLLNRIITLSATLDSVIEFFVSISTIDTLWFGLLTCVIYCIYFCIIPIYFKKQTIGRAVAKVRIVKLNGEKMSFGTLLFREFVGKIFLGLMTFGIVWIVSVVMMFKATIKRTIHDRMANTLMVPISAVKDNKLIIEETIE